MKTQTTLILGILMLATAMASPLYGGDTLSFETNITDPVYIVTGNSSNLDGLNITFENGSIFISPALKYKPDNFTLIFLTNETKEIIKEVVVHSGGGSRTKYIDRNVTVFVPVKANETEEPITVQDDESTVILEPVEDEEKTLNDKFIIGTFIGFALALVLLIKYLKLRYKNDSN